MSLGDHFQRCCRAGFWRPGKIAESLGWKVRRRAEKPFLAGRPETVHFHLGERRFQSLFGRERVKTISRGVQRANLRSTEN